MYTVYKLQANGNLAIEIGKVRKSYEIGEKLRLKSCLYELVVVRKDEQAIYCKYKHENMT